MLESLSHDIRLAARSLCRTPVFTATVILTLGLGIGANTAMFSLLDAVVLKPLPVAKPNELFVLRVQAPGAEPDIEGGTGRWLRFPYPVVRALEGSLPSGASLAALTRVTPYDVRGATGVGDTVGVQLVSDRYFSTFGVSPVRGRLIGAGDNERVDGHPIAVISHAYWQRGLSGDPEVIGRTLRVNNVPVTIVGVIQPGFNGPSSDAPVSVWLPLMMQHAVHYASNLSSYGDEVQIEQQPWALRDEVSWLSVIVRAPGGLTTVAPRLTQTYLAEMRRLTASISQPAIRDQLAQQTLGFDPAGRGFSVLRRSYATPLLMLSALVGLVLLLACANLANLLLVRAAVEESKMRVRAAIGASRARLLAQKLIEALMLTAAGVAAALLIGRAITVWIAGRVLNVADDALPPAFNQDHRVFVFTLAVGALATLCFAVVPAWVTTRRIQMPDSRRYTDRALIRRGMRPLLAMQVAIALLLGITAVWFQRSLFNVLQLNPGFDNKHLVALSINPRNSGYAPEELPGLYERITEAAQSVPDVQSAAVAACGLSENCRSILGYRIEGYPENTADGIELRGNRVGPGYFSTVGIRLVEGREFDEHDSERAPQVAIVTRSLAARYFGGRSPLGKRIGYTLPDREIVGVVEDARVEELHVEPVPMVYTPIAQTNGDYAYSLDVRVSGNPSAVSSVLREVIARREPRLSIFNSLSLDDRLDRNRTRDTLLGYLTTAFGLLALLLASLGLYGVLAYLVAKRTREIGIRMAVGAQPVDVARMVIAEGMHVVLVGLAVGMGLALAAGGPISSMLFNVSPSDPTVFAVVAGAIGATTLGACYLPARRASRVQPVIALQVE